jgi:hypothetical protein
VASPPPPPRAAQRQRGGGRLTRVGFCHRGVNAWAEGRQGEVGRGVLPSQESFFQPFPCPVKWVSISQGLPLLCLRAPDEAENRRVEGLKERSRMEGIPSTPPPCLSPEKPTRVRGRGEGVSPEGQVARIPVDVRVHFFKFILGWALQRGIRN